MNDKIKAIYEKIAQNTEISDKLNGLNENSLIEYSVYSELMDLTQVVMIGDVLDWIDLYIGYNKSDNLVNDESLLLLEIINIWKDLRKPIEEQSKECIDYIYNLITNE